MKDHEGIRSQWIVIDSSNTQKCSGVPFHLKREPSGYVFNTSEQNVWAVMHNGAKNPGHILFSRCFEM